MGRRYYPRKQTSVSYAADCEGIRCYGGGPSRPTSINPTKRLDRDHCRRALTWRNASLIASSIEPCRRQPRRIAPRQKSKGLLELSNPSKRRSTDHETVVPSFWEYPSRTVTLRADVPPETITGLHLKRASGEDRVLQTVVVTKTQWRADELVALVRLRLNGHYARVPITIERDGDTWAAVAHIESAITRGRIEFAARKVGELNALAPDSA